jgi:hypothetical protein
MQCPPAPSAWPEGGEAEGLRRGRRDHRARRHAECRETAMQLVHQGDVHEPICVLEQLRTFRDLGRRDGNDGVDDPVPDRLGPREGCGVRRAEQARHLARIAPIARILPFRRDGQEDVPPDPRTVAFQRLAAHAVGRAGLAGGDEADQRAREQPGTAGLERRAHGPRVRLPGIVERRRHAEQPVRRLRQEGRVGGHGEAADRAAPPPGRRGTVGRGGIDVAAGHVEACRGGRQRQRQADMAEAEHHQPLGQRRRRLDFHVARHGIGHAL